MAADFDPYHKWLGIPPTQQPPHHYRLLGIDLYEGDPDVIANAADRQMGHVRSMASGPFAAASQRLLNELSSAKLCLLDARRKSVYDVQLADGVVRGAAPAGPRVEIAPAEPLLAEIAASPAAEDDWDAAVGEQEGSTSHLRRARRRVSELSIGVKLIGHLIASVGGLALGYWVLCWIGPQYDFLGLAADAEIPAEAAAEVTAPAPLAGDTIPRSASPTTTPAAGQAPPRQAIGFQGTQPARPPAGSQTPSPTQPPGVRRPAVAAPSNAPRQPVATRPASQPIQPPAAVIPPYIDLPPLASDELTLIRGLPLAAANVRLQLLVNPLAEDDPRLPRLREEAAAGDRRWSVVLAASDESNLAALPALARFSLRGGELRFAWTPEAATEPAAGQLRNALLEVAAGGLPKVVALRAPLSSPPLVFGLDKKSTLLRLDLPDLPPADQLRLTISATRLPVTGTLDPPGGTAPFGKRVAIGIEPGIELRINASKTTSGPALNLSGAYKLPEMAGEDFTSEQLAFHQGSLEKQLSDDRAEIGQREGYASELPGRLQEVAGRTLSSNAARARQQAHENNKEMVAIRREIRKNTRMLDSLKKRIPRIEANLAALRAVVQMSSQVNGAAVHFRLEYEVAGRTLLLAASQPPN